VYTTVILCVPLEAVVVVVAFPPDKFNVEIFLSSNLIVILPVTALLFESLTASVIVILSPTTDGVVAFNVIIGVIF
jgi:hypothetical protein